ncbi:MAG: methyltransferase [Bacteroidales bacterium]|nr:methyltransferase [Bacteroidales bacterium]
MLKITRYPETKNKSLQVSSTADDYLLNYLKESDIPKGNLALVNDRFGYLACHLSDWKPYSVIAFKSQEKALRMNFENNTIQVDETHLLSPLDSFPTKLDLALVKVPKSVDLFRLYLNQINEASHNDTVVVCTFMTKYFSKQLLKIAEEFFEVVEQSLAWKKSRLLILKKPKKVADISFLSSLKLNTNIDIQQYPGVFSANNVDYATQFLLDNIKLKESEQSILDLGSGNGVIAVAIQDKYKQNNWQEPKLHLMDDSFLAVESSKLNLPSKEAHFHYTDDLEDFEDKTFDLVVSNPPFHFDYEINTEITMDFFEQAYTVLKPNGRFILVFNRHLRYNSLLKRIFSQVNVMVDSPKFMVMECVR